MRVGTYDCAESAIRFCSETHVQPGVGLKAVDDSLKRHIESLEGRHELCPKPWRLLRTFGELRTEDNGNHLGCV
jgi:hypothetical protein